MEKLIYEKCEELNNLGEKDNDLCEMIIGQMITTSDISCEIYTFAENCSQNSGKILFNEYGWILYSDGFVTEAQSLYPNEKDLKNILKLSHAKYIERLLFKNLELIARNCIRSIVNENELPISEEEIFNIELKTLLDRDRLDFIDDNILTFLKEKTSDYYYDNNYDDKFGDFDDYDLKIGDFYGKTIEEIIAQNVTI